MDKGGIIFPIESSYFESKLAKKVKDLQYCAERNNLKDSRRWMGGDVKNLLIGAIKGMTEKRQMSFSVSGANEHI